MKQIYVTLTIIFGSLSLSAQNTFPSSGNVGVGTASPNSALHISTGGSSINGINQYTGDLIVEGKPGSRSATIGASIEFVIPANTDGNNPWGQARINTVAGNENSGNATGKMIFGTRRYFDKGIGTAWNYGDDLVIDGVGNVGIGTKYPQALLDAGRVLNSGDLGSVLARLPEGNSAGSGTFLGVRGHGTTIGEDGRAKSFSLEHGFYGQTNSAINFFRGGAVTGGGISFSTDNNTEKMWILDNGNVGIGTAYPVEKLAVNGVVRAKELVAQTANWPDYVFEKNYNLISLADIEKYVLVNKHLPNMPSAKDIESQGQKLGEINAKLLKTVEELTLHLIEKDKQLKEQEARLSLHEENAAQQAKVLKMIMIKIGI